MVFYQVTDDNGNVVATAAEVEAAYHATLARPTLARSAAVRPSKARSALVSPTRFLNWYSAVRPTTAPAHRVASDAALATVDAGLCDIAGTRFPGLFILSPELATSEWQYLRDTVRKVRTIKHRALTPAMLAADLAALPTSLVPVRTMLASAADPTAHTSTGGRLRQAAQRFVRLATGETLPTMDVWSKHHNRWLVKADPSAFRGTPRYQLPRPCISDQVVTDHTAVSATGVILAKTVLTFDRYCVCGAETRGKCACAAVGWEGHQRVTFPRTVKATKRSNATTRKTDGSTSTRGRKVTAWTMSDRSLVRACARFAEQYAAMDRIMRMATEGQTLTLSDGATVTILASSQVSDSHRGRAYPIREYARRAAIAQLTVATV